MAAQLDESKTIIISGANGDLGTATVKKFLGKGYRVLAVDTANDKLRDAGKHRLFSFRKVNLSEEKEAEQFVREAAGQYKILDGCLLLVGGFAMGSLDETAGEDLRKMFSLNFETAYFLSRPVFQHMLGQGHGRIVFMGARPALKASQGKNALAYMLSKSLLFKFAEVLNELSKGTGVSVSVVVPSTIDTATNRKSMPDADPEKWVKAEQIAEVLEFICSTKADPLREMIFKVYNKA